MAGMKTSRGWHNIVSSVPWLIITTSISRRRVLRRTTWKNSTVCVLLDSRSKSATFSGMSSRGELRYDSCERRCAMRKALRMAFARLSPIPSRSTKSSKEAVARSDREEKCLVRDRPAAFPAIADSSSWLFGSGKPNFGLITLLQKYQGNLSQVGCFLKVVSIRFKLYRIETLLKSCYAIPTPPSSIPIRIALIHIQKPQGRDL